MMEITTTSINPIFTTARKGVKMPRVYFMNIDVDLGAESQVARDNPGTIGARVDCVVPGKNRAEAVELLTDALRQDGYTLYKMNELGNFVDYDWENEQLRTEYYSYAWQAHANGIVSYGAFYAYDTRE